MKRAFFIGLFAILLLLTACSPERAMRLCNINFRVAETKAKDLTEVNIGATSLDLDYYIQMTSGTGNGNHELHYHSINEGEWYRLDDPVLSTLTFSQGAWNFTAVGVANGTDKNQIDANTILLEGTLSDFYINLFTSDISIPVTYKAGNADKVNFNYTFDATKYNVKTSLYQYQNGSPDPTEVTTGYLANNYVIDGNKSGTLPSGTYIVVIFVEDKSGNTVLIDACAFCVYQGQITEVTGKLKEGTAGAWTGEVDIQESGTDTSKCGLKEALEEAKEKFTEDDPNHTYTHVVEVTVKTVIDKIVIQPNTTTDPNADPTAPIFAIPGTVDKVDLNLNGSNIEIQQATFSPQTALFHVDSNKTLNINNTDTTRLSIIVPSNNGNNGNSNATFALDGGTISLTRIIAQGPSGQKTGSSDKTHLGVINLAGCTDHPHTSHGGRIELNHTTLAGNRAAITNIAPPAAGGGGADYTQVTTIDRPITIILDNDSHLTTKYTDAITLKNVSTAITIEILNGSSIDGVISLPNFSGTLTIKCPASAQPTVSGATPQWVYI